MDGVGFGTAYYAEYQRNPDLRADFDLMAQAGFTVIRVGESVWSTWEPQDGHPSTLPRSTGPMGWVVRGPWAVTQLADLMYSSKQAPFLVTETNGGSIGFSSMNESPYDGQWRQLAWLLVARGARLVEYWHWNTLPFGAEAYWGGVLPHSGIPGRAYAEIARTGQELRAAGAAFATAQQRLKRSGRRVLVPLVSRRRRVEDTCIPRKPT